MENKNSNGVGANAMEGDKRTHDFTTLLLLSKKRVFTNSSTALVTTYRVRGALRRSSAVQRTKPQRWGEPYIPSTSAPKLLNLSQAALLRVEEVLILLGNFDTVVASSETVWVMGMAWLQHILTTPTRRRSPLLYLALMLTSCVSFVFLF